MGQALKLNNRSEFSLRSFGTFARMCGSHVHSNEEDTMKKLGYVVAALGALAIVAPTMANAETVVI